MRHLAGSLGLLSSTLISCSAPPAAQDPGDLWAGLRAPELRRIGILEARQLVEGTVTEHAEFTSWASIGSTPLGITVVSLASATESPLEPGDVIVGVRGLDISMVEEFLLVLESAPAGTELELMFHRTARPDWPAMPSLKEFPARSVRLRVGD